MAVAPSAVHTQAVLEAEHAQMAQTVAVAPSAAVHTLAVLAAEHFEVAQAVAVETQAAAAAAEKVAQAVAVVAALGYMLAAAVALAALAPADIAIDIDDVAVARVVAVARSAAVVATAAVAAVAAPAAAAATPFAPTNYHSTSAGIRHADLASVGPPATFCQTRVPGKVTCPSPPAGKLEHKIATARLQKM